MVLPKAMVLRGQVYPISVPISQFSHYGYAF